MKISIITPSFNQRVFLARTAESILSQPGDFELEWIVVDAASTDGTLELLQSLRDPRLTFSSEPDRGQSHAINKGLAAAGGDVVAWLNADDVYAPGALTAVAAAFTDHPGSPWLVGRCQIIDEHDRLIRPGIARYKERCLARYSYRKLLRENFIPQPAVFWRRCFGQSIGPLDESLHFTMDYDLWLRMGKAAAPLIIDQSLAQFRMHAGSKSGRVDRRQFDEGYEVACRYCDADGVSRIAHRLNVEKIVWAYRVLQLVGR
jgi:glycosyltransferase involved in cell wall biosynthesis